MPELDNGESEAAVSDQVMIAFSSAMPGREDDYLAWYKDQHMPDILAVDGIDDGTMYRIEDASPHRPARFVSVYRMSQSPEQVLADMMRRNETGHVRRTDALDPASASIMFCRALFSS